MSLKIICVYASSQIICIKIYYYRIFLLFNVIGLTTFVIFLLYYILVYMGNRHNQAKKSKWKELPFENTNHIREKARLGMEKK